MNRRNWMLTTLLVVVALVALAAGFPGSQAVQAQDDMSRVRFLHAVPGAPSVDVYLDGSLVVTDLAFGRATPHLNVGGGEHQVALRQAGTGATGPVLLEVPVPLVPGLAFTVVAQGSVEALEAALYEDILDEIAPGLARLTAINAIADAPPVDVVTTEGGPLLQGVSYGAQFGTVNIGTGVQDLVLVPAGGAVESALAPVGQVPLTSGVLYTFVALGTLEGTVTPSSLVLATPLNGADGSVLVQVAHGSPDAPAVDVYANDMLLVPSLNVGQLSGHIALPPGDYALALRPAGTPAADPPVLETPVTLDAATPAVTVLASGLLSEENLALQVLPDPVAGIASDMARLSVINAVPGASATVTLSDASETVLAAALGTNAQAQPANVPIGDYMLLVNIQTANTGLDVVVPAEAYYGGVYYTVLVYGGGGDGAIYDARTSATEVAVTDVSLLAPQADPIVAEPAMEDTDAGADAAADAEGDAGDSEVVQDDAPPADAPADDAAAADSEVVQDDAPPADAPTETPPANDGGDTEVVTDDPAPALADSEVVQDDAPAQPAQQTPPPDTATAVIELNPGANLHCREYPRPDALSLGLIPAGTQVFVLGRTGEPLVPETGDPTPEPTPVIETLDDVWLAVRWNTPDGGYLRCWVAAQFLRVEYKGQFLTEVEDFEELPEEPFNRPGEAVNTDVSPPTPLYDAVLATVNLEPGVSLQIRRYPDSNAEALDRAPAQAQLEVLGVVEAPSEGLVGQPVDPNWLRVRYRKENGASVVGWVSAQYVTITQLNRPVAIEDLPEGDPEEAGFYEAAGTQPQIPIEEQDVLGVVNLNPGANLNLRDRPTVDARVVVGIPSGSVLTLIGRNGDGTWVQATYESPTGELSGWVASQYLVITRGGEPYELAELDNVTDEEDTLAAGAAAPPADAPPAEAEAETAE